jgi:N6-adenosine-specific RNA methylase IME4
VTDDRATAATKTREDDQARHTPSRPPTGGTDESRGDDMSKPRLIPITSLSPHPDNPRLVVREDVVAAIVAGLDGEYPLRHAITVRPLGGGYQILAGHTRVEAARRKGLTHVWAWVVELEDAAAFMELVTSNSQGELSPLEIGLHALKAVPKEQGKKGGGLKAYAEQLGRSERYVGQIRQAAEVLSSTSEVNFRCFLDRAQHLCALHKLPRACWAAAVGWLAGADASVADVDARVAEALAFREGFDAGEDWADYLPIDRCTTAVFQGADPNTFRRLLDLAAKVAEELKAHEDLVARWRAWLAGHAGGDSWDIRTAQDKRIELEAVAWDREHEPEPQRPAVNLVLADPPWRYEHIVSDSRRVENQYPTATVEEICSHIHAPWAPPVADDCVLFLWATAPLLREALQVMAAWGFEYTTHAMWDKEKVGMGYWFRGQHELLLVGTRGSASPPPPELRVSSVFREARKGHSEKPGCVYAAIEAMFPGAVRCEFYQRRPREGWRGAGIES